MEFLKGKIKIDRNELSGAFGDIGTDLPLIVGMILASGLDSASVLIMFGVMQIFTALVYGLPMPLQPLKAVALIVIAQNIEPLVIYGGGLAIGITMLILTLSGLVKILAIYIPKAVIRGIQLGLGLQLANIALRQYIGEASTGGFVLAGIAFILSFVLLGNRKYPPAIVILIVGIVYGFAFNREYFELAAPSITLPEIYTPGIADILSGFVLLALPQIPLSLGNSILATNQVIKDYFPEKNIKINKISFTYSLVNLITPWFGGIPACHGSGGMVGHYTFGARTGGSLVIYGGFFLLTGLLFSSGFENLLNIFPLPILGVILLFEALYLIFLVKDVTHVKEEFVVTILTGLLASGLPYGFFIAFVVGTILFYLMKFLNKRIESGKA